MEKRAGIGLVRRSVMICGARAAPWTSADPDSYFFYEKHPDGGTLDSSRQLVLGAVGVALAAAAIGLAPAAASAVVAAAANASAVGVSA